MGKNCKCFRSVLHMKEELIEAYNAGRIDGVSICSGGTPFHKDADDYVNFKLELDIKEKIDEQPDSER